MKKIIALAVASAFVTPAFADNANFTLSGDMEYRYISGEDNTQLSGGDQVVVFTGSTETDDGLVVTGVTSLSIGNDQSATSDGGDHISVAGGFGKVSIGDVSGGLDNVGDYSDVSPVGGEFAGDGSDASILYVLPTMVEGLKVSASHTPEGANFAGNSEMDAYSVAYGFSGGEVYYGAQSKANSTDMAAYGVKASFGGLMVAYEIAKEENPAADLLDVDYTGIAATYSIDNTKVAIEQQTADLTVAGVATLGEATETVISVTQSLGGGLSVYLANESNELKDASTGVTATEDKTTAGIVYKF